MLTSLTTVQPLSIPAPTIFLLPFYQQNKDRPIKVIRAYDYSLLIIFVILADSPPMFMQPSQDSLDQDRLVTELKVLDHRLNFKSNQATTQPKARPQENSQSFSKYPELRECDRLFANHNNHIEYFSEINNKDNQEDSLFDQEMRFLAHPTTKKVQNAAANVVRGSNAGRVEERKEVERSNVGRLGEMNASKDSRNAAILKEQEYIFRKEKNEDNSLRNARQNASSVNSRSSKALPQKPRQNIKNQPYIEKNSKGIKKYDQNLHSYLFQENQPKKEKDQHQRMHTEDLPHNTESIEFYLENLVSSQVARKLDYDSKSIKSRVKTQATEAEGCTFQPKILKKSKEMVRNSKNVVERLSTSNTQKNIKVPYQPARQNVVKPRMERIDELSQPRKLKTIDLQDVEQLPTFKPNLSKKSLQHMSNCTYDVATRNKLWLEQKQQKIQRMRKQQEEGKLKKEQSSYSPAIRVYRGQQDAQFSRFGKQGMVQYFQRLSMMKKKSVSNLKKDDTLALISYQQSQTNKENTLNALNRPSTSNLYKSKKQTYQQAVKTLHSKIMKLKI